MYGTNLFQPQQVFAGIDNLSQSNICIFNYRLFGLTLWGTAFSWLEWSNEQTFEKNHVIIVVDLGEMIAEYQSTIFSSLICDLLLLPVLLLFFS